MSDPDPLVAPVVGGTPAGSLLRRLDNEVIRLELFKQEHVTEVVGFRGEHRVECEVCKQLDLMIGLFREAHNQLQPLGWETGLPINDYGRRCYAAGKAFNEHEAFHAHNGMMKALAERDTARAELAALVPRPEPRAQEPNK